MTDPQSLPPEQDMLAAELALGLLEGAERHEAELLQATDSAFAEVVREWQQRGVGLLLDLPAEPPSSDLWPGLESAVHRPALAHPSQAVERISPREGAGPWKALALAASLSTLVFAGLWALAPAERVGVPVDQPFQPSSYSVAQVQGDDAQALLSAIYDRRTGKIYLSLAEIADHRRVPQLWLIDAAGTPHSLGFAKRKSLAALALDKEQQALVEQGGVLALSLEEPAAQPHEVPGDVLGSSQISAIGSQL